MKKYIFIPISILVVICIAFITIEVPYYSKMIGFSTLLYLSLCLTFGMVMILYITWWGAMKGEDKWVAGGSTILFSFVVILGLVSFFNRCFAQNSCYVESYEVHQYDPRYASGYGKTDAGKVQPNQWVITIKDQAVYRTFTLRKDIMGKDVTNTINLEFCRGILSTKYLNE